MTMRRKLYKTTPSANSQQWQTLRSLCGMSKRQANNLNLTARAKEEEEKEEGIPLTLAYSHVLSFSLPLSSSLSSHYSPATMMFAVPQAQNRASQP
jgi:hypothetical protein